MKAIDMNDRNTTLPLRLRTVDLSGEAFRHVVVARGTPELYQGHADTVLLPDRRTMFCVWTLNHGWGEPFLRRSDDAGLSWHDAAIPEDGTPGVYQAESFDGGLTWGNEREVIPTGGLPGVKMISRQGKICDFYLLLLFSLPSHRDGNAGIMEC